MRLMLLTIPQAADQLDLSRQRVWLLVTTGRIRAQRVGQAWLISDGELKRFGKRERTNGRPRTTNHKPTRTKEGR